MNSNDKRILDLKKKIEEKEKQQKKKKKRFSPVTNCLLNFYGKTFNLHAASKEDIDILLVTLQPMLKAAAELEIDPATIKVSGYSLTDWMTDVKAKRSTNSVAEQTAALKTMKAKLHQLLSSDKKVELEIDDIEKFLS